MHRPIELTRSQSLMWAGHNVWSSHAVSNVAFAFLIDGPLQPECFARAWRHVVAHTDALRIVIGNEAGMPTQIVLEQAPFELEYVDLSTTQDPAAACETWLAERAARRFDVTVRTVDTALLELGERRFVWYLCQHHLVSDGVSATLLFRRVSQCYEDMLAGGQALPTEYPRFVDYVQFEREYQRSAAWARAQAYWAHKMTERCQPLSFYGSRPRDLSVSPRQERIHVELGRARSEALRALAGAPGIKTVSEQLSVFSVLAAVLCTYLHRMTGHERLCIGVPAHNRIGRRFADTVGLLMEQDPWYFTVEDDDTFMSLARKAQQEALAVMRHVPCAPGNPGGRVFEVGLNYVTASFGRFAGLPVRARWIHPGAGDGTFALTVHDYDGAGALQAEFDFNAEVFSPENRRRAVTHVLNLLDACLANPEERLARARMLDDDERHELVHGRSGPRDAALCDGSFLEWVAAQVQAQPASPAAEDDAQRAWSYGELWERSARVAGALRALGVARGDLVGVRLARGVPMLGVLLGILRAGAAYLPLDPTFPRERLAYMLADGGAALVVTDEPDSPIEEATPMAEPLARVHPDALLSAPLATNDLAPPDAGDLAYVIYTSGSTGRPKGVEITHGALRNTLGGLQRELGLRADDVLLAVTTLSFDISGLELFLPLCVGARVLIPDHRVVTNGTSLAQALQRSSATVMQGTPATWQMLRDGGWRGRLRLILCGGEALPEELAAELPKCADTVLNLYGPTETTIWSTLERVDGPHSISVGRPIANTRVYVLDRHGQLVPDDVTGEIWIAGAGVARSYRGRAALTAERFRPDPFVAHERMYRTGDLGRWRADGRLELLGRSDFQVKVHGYRIELGEIEAALDAFAEVRRAVVVAQGEGEDRRLVAYVVFEPGQALMPGEVRRRLADTLPQYMIPGLVIALDALPLTPNGKVDRKALPNPLAGAGADMTFEPPAGEVEQSLAEVWCSLLSVPQVGRHDNFFELGGHSLLVLRAVAEIKRRTGGEVDPRAFFFRTLSQIAMTLRATSAA